MSLLDRLRDILVDSGNRILQGVTEYSPHVLAAIALIVVGLVVAKLAEWICLGTLRRLRFDAFLERVGIPAPVRGEERQELSRWAARTAYFLIVLLFAGSAVEVLGLEAASESFRAALGYVPNLLSALLVIVVGVAVANALAALVVRGAASLGEGHARLLGRGAAGFVYLVVAVMAVSQLRLESLALQAVMVAVLLGAALGLAGSFALGSRDITRSILAGFYARRLLRSGDAVEIAGQKGTLVTIGATQTVVETKGALKIVPNDAYLDSVVEKRTRE